MKPQLSDTFNRNKEILQQLMQSAHIDNLDTLSKLSGISVWQLNRLQLGLIPKLTVENLVKLSLALKIPIDKSLALFYPEIPSVALTETPESSVNLEDFKELQQDYGLLLEKLEQQEMDFQKEVDQVNLEASATFEKLNQLQKDYQLLQEKIKQQEDDLSQNAESSKTESLANLEKLNQLQKDYENLQKQLEQQEKQLNQEIQKASLEASTHLDNFCQLKQEYELLQNRLEKQEETLKQEFQQSSLEVLESWLLQWPTAAAAAQKNPKLSAVKLLVLVKPVVELLKRWGVENIGSVGEKVPYDPQYHQLLEGNAITGDLVEVRYVGYRQDDRLLYRAKVSPVNPSAN
jgi:molecular chaperone GrpE (heat shock protein)